MISDSEEHHITDSACCNRPHQVSSLNFSLTSLTSLNFPTRFANSRIRRGWWRYVLALLSHHNIKHHHQYETDGEANGAAVAVFAVGRLWNQFFHYHIDHGSCCKSKHIG